MKKASAEDYYSQQLALLPTGPAWPRDDDFAFNRVLRAKAEEHARTHNRAIDAREEADPRSTYYMLSEWEEFTGLPDECTSNYAITLQERRAAVIQKLLAEGGLNQKYFEALIKALGYEATIYRYRPFVCGASQCGEPVGGTHKDRFIWRVHVHGPRITYFECGVSACGDSLGKITRAEDLECILNRDQAAYGKVYVTYGDDMMPVAGPCSEGECSL